MECFAPSSPNEKGNAVVRMYTKLFVVLFSFNWINLQHMVLSATVTSLHLDFFNLIIIIIIFLPHCQKQSLLKKTHNRRSNVYSAKTATDKMKVEKY